MTLPSRLVSLLLVYCFVCSLSAAVRAPTSVGISTRTNPTEVGALTPLDRAYDLLSSLFSSRQPNSSDDEDADKQEAGLKFRLSQAPQQPEAKATNKIAQASVLSDAETQAILNRLPLIKTDASDEVDFALRDKSLPPPRTGATVMQPFPAALDTAPPDQKPSGPLEVVRQSPEGDVPIAPNLSVTFSQPMVGVTSQEEAAENVPVKLSPQPPGKWHWIGTRTLLFEPDVRFPMATQYSVTVPAGTNSANGGVLGQAKSWTFTTPPPTVKNFYPAKAGVQRRDVLMFAEFDQRIDPKAVVENLTVVAGTAQVATRLATKDEIDADENVKDLVKNAGKDRWLAFRAIDANGSTADEKQTGVAEYGSRSFGYGWWWLRPEWFEHQNLRDDRVEAFTSLLWEGVYKYSYVARATTPGQFIVPPAKAEEMYHPETFGKGRQIA
ncbi:MAG TPA: Ig-like domain-containing protein [Pyrinomonadaceae bacterium]